MYGMGKYIHYPLINHNGKEYEKVYIYTHICIQTHITESLCCTVKINKTL